VTTKRNTFKQPCICIGMPRISYGDRRALGCRAFIFNAGVLPEVQQLVDAWPSYRRPELTLEQMPVSELDQLAWMLNNFGYAQARSLGYRSDRCAGFDTYVFGPSEYGGGVFDDWFDGMPDRYRIMIHQVPPLPHDGSRRHDAESAWCPVYRKQKISTRRTTTPAMRETVKGTLSELLSAYRTEAQDPQMIVDRMGHPHGYSDSFPY